MDAACLFGRGSRLGGCLRRTKTTAGGDECQCNRGCRYQTQFIHLLASKLMCVESHLVTQDGSEKAHGAGGRPHALLFCFSALASALLNRRSGERCNVA